MAEIELWSPHTWTQTSMSNIHTVISPTHVYICTYTHMQKIYLCSSQLWRLASLRACTCTRPITSFHSWLWTLHVSQAREREDESRLLWPPTLSITNPSPQQWHWSFRRLLPSSLILHGSHPSTLLHWGLFLSQELRESVQTHITVSKQMISYKP